MWKRKDFERVNGWSNLFVNWGGEDDDMSYRFFPISINILKIYSIIYVLLSELNTESLYLLAFPAFSSKKMAMSH